MLTSGSPPSSDGAPPVCATSPATSRNKEDLPTPLGPSTTKASPAPTVKPSPVKTWRPPRKQARSDPKRRIRSPPATSGPIPQFASTRDTFRYELRNLRTASVDYLEHCKKRTYKPEPSGPILAQPSRKIAAGDYRGVLVSWCRTVLQSGRMGTKPR